MSRLGLVSLVLPDCFLITRDHACPRRAQKTVWSTALQDFVLPSQGIRGKLMKHIKVLTTLSS